MLENFGKLEALEKDKKEKQEKGQWKTEDEKEFETKTKEINADMNQTLEGAKLQDWWASAKSSAKDDVKPVEEAALYGGRMALKFTAAVPATMAVLYLLLILYFMTQGGYRRVEISRSMNED